MDQLDSDIAEVVITKGNSPEESVLDGIEKLGGISKFIDDGDQVFIKINLRLPFGFPTNTNLDTLKAIIQSCNSAGAKKVYVGSFPIEDITVKAISDSLQLKDYFKEIKIPFPILLLRNSALLVSEKKLAKLEKLNIEIESLFLKTSDLSDRLTHQLSGIKIDFSSQRDHLHRQFMDMYE
ncbi:MAG: bacillithiol biosynthesis BshC, partial [Candidatus Lokiarchaeota archaeon]|nr:bacillithiol biosynthesis BshC [Candidatus Lokiarchaeota archaeon]